MATVTLTKADVLLMNGSFETVAISASPGLTIMTHSNTNLPGWTVTSNTINVVRSNVWQAAEGKQSLDLTGEGFYSGGIRQTLQSVKAGEAYNVRFWMAGNPSAGTTGNPVKGMFVSFGSAITNFTFNTSGYTNQNMGCTPKDWYLPASGNAVQIQFWSTNVGNSGPALDKVDVRHGS